ncbi:hypothetical protein ANCCAN_09812 [Ancylostoma caninum]|uniref:Uncharacterized protein n=1 Tax=Ancylostoma caninum TaxID=29170 RepID=A0A368GLR9_ANCCA|nr:hypothetical protein ANCCAN_09812 [Ancylostoma caninum]
MDTVVFLALAVLAAVFVVSLLVLVVMCQRRRMQVRSFKLATASPGFSKLRNENLDGHITQLSPLIGTFKVTAHLSVSFVSFFLL